MGSLADFYQHSHSASISSLKELTAIILACAGLDFLEFGYDQGLLGGILSGDRFREMLGEPGPTMEGLLSGIYTVGCAGGALVSFIWGEKLGRVGSILWANVIGKNNQNCISRYFGLSKDSDYRCGHSDGL